MKNRFKFCALCCLLVSLQASSVWGQTTNHGFCGAYVKPAPPANGSEGSTVYFDRFGNKYHAAELLPPPVEGAPDGTGCTDAGHFNLTYIGNFPVDECETFCEVFSYLSGLIANPTGNTVNINIVKEPFANNGVLATGTALYADGACGVEPNLVWNKLYTTAMPATQTADGLLRVNANYTAQQWHTFAEGPDAPAGTFDLYTVALHEALHILGFSSRIRADGSPTNGFYSLWDTHLFSQTDNAHLVVAAANPTACCDERVFNSGVFANMPDDVISECSGTPMILFTAGAIAEVNADYNGLPFPSDDDLVRNTLSHLCDDDLVMFAGLADGEEKRTVSNIEQKILCVLGYVTDPICTETCIVQANDDNFSLTGNQIDITYDELLANDFPDDAVAVLLTPCGNSGNVNITLNSGGFSVAGLPAGLTRLCYEITGCDGQCDQASIFIFVIETEDTDCETPNSCELVIGGDFEDIDDFLPFRFFFITPSPDNSVDFYEDCNFDPHYGSPNFFCLNAPPDGDVCHNPAMPGDHFVHAGSHPSNVEGFFLPLCRPTQDCSYELSFWMLSGCANTLHVAFSAEIPCPSNTGPIMQGVLLNNAPSVVCNTLPTYTYEAPLILDIPFTDTDENNDGVPEWVRITQVITPPLGMDVITLYQEPAAFDGHGQSLYLDDISLWEICAPDITVESVVENACIGGDVVIEYTICADEPVTIDLTASLPNIPGIQFSNSGDFPNGSTTIFIDPAVSNCVTLQLVLDVDLSVLPGSFDVTLLAEVANGCDGQGIETEVTTVTLDNTSQPPFATFTYDDDNCPEIAFTSTDQSAGATHFWDFGDGGTSTEVNPTHTFADPQGTYIVEHCVTNDCGTVCVTEEITLDCEPELFACPCTEANSLNIDAGAGANLSAIPELANLPNGELDLDQHGHCIAIRGRLIIDQHFAIFDPYDLNESQVRMQPGSEIVVPATKRLTMRGLDILGCEQMWRGITVEQKGRLYFTINTISDAQFAIRAIPSSGDGLSKPTLIQVIRNTFSRNHVGVLIEEGPETDAIAHFPFQANRFLSVGSSQPLLPPFDNIDHYNNLFGYAGVVALNDEFTIGSGNHFSLLRNGAIGEKCRLDVQNCRFENLVGTTPAAPSYAGGSQGIAVLANGGRMRVYDSYFNKMNHAMYAFDNPVEAIGNHIEAIVGLETHWAWSMVVQENDPVRFVDYGVTAQDVAPVLDGGFNGNYIVEGNKFYSTNTYFDLIDRWAVEFTNTDQMTPPVARISTNFAELNDQVGGIQVSNVNGWEISWNEIRLMPNPSQQPIDATGINLDNTTGNYLYGNMVVDATAGTSQSGASIGYETAMSTGNTWCCNYAEGVAAGFKFTGNCLNSDFRHNVMDLTQTALYCTDATRTSVQADKGNWFFAGSGNALHEGSDNDIAASEFHVYDANMNDVVDDVPHSPEFLLTADWFFPSDVEADLCAYDAACVVPPQYPDPPGRELEPNDYGIAAGVYDYTTRGKTLFWESRRNLYDRMKRYPELHGVSETIDGFYSGSAENAVGQYWTADATVRAISDISPTLRAQLQALLAALETNEAAVQAKLAQLAQATNWPDSLAIYEHADSIRLLATSNLQLLMTAMGAVALARKTQAGQALSMVAALPAEDVYDENRRTAYAIYLSTVSQGAAQLSAADFAVIADIAAQCPLEGGSGVYLARALYQYNDRKYFDDNLLCAQARGRDGTGAHSTTGILLAPNPANGWVDVLLDGPVESEGQDLTIRLFNLTGQEVLARRAASDARVVRLEVGSLPDGWYHCTVTGAGRTLLPAKLLLQR